MEIAILVIHVLVALAIVGLVLLQHGKGADVGAAFGSGASGSLFGAAGSANFLSRTTAILAAIFFVTSLSLTYLSARRSEGKGVISGPPAPTRSEPGRPADAAAVPVPEAPGAPAEGGSKVPDIPK